MEFRLCYDSLDNLSNTRRYSKCVSLRCCVNPNQAVAGLRRCKRPAVPNAMIDRAENTKVQAVKVEKISNAIKILLLRRCLSLAFY
jgi:hypothetical protein